MPRSRVRGCFSPQPADTPYAREATSSGWAHVAELAARLEQFVFGSVDLAGRDSSCQTKLRIERHLAILGLPTTVLRPVMSMKNNVHPSIGIRGKYSVLRVVAEGVTVQLIATDDIGAFATLVFADPTTHLGRVYELAGDQSTKAELSNKSTAATGAKPDLTSPKNGLGGRIPDPGKLIKDRPFAHWHADIPAPRRIHLGFKTWLNAGRRDAFRKLFGQPQHRWIDVERR